MTAQRKGQSQEHDGTPPGSEILREPLPKSPRPAGYVPLACPRPCLRGTHPGPPSGGGWKGPGQVLRCLPPAPSPWVGPNSGQNSGRSDGGQYLEYAGSVRGPPGVEEVVLPSAHEPLAYGREAKGASACGSLPRMEGRTHPRQGWLPWERGVSGQPVRG